MDAEQFRPSQLGVVYLVAIVSICYMLLFALESEDAVLWVSIVCQVTMAGLTVRFGAKHWGWRFFDPATTVVAAYTVFYAGGIVLYEIREWLGLWRHPADMIEVAHLGVTGFAILCVTLLLSSTFSGSPSTEDVRLKTTFWSPSGLRIATIVSVLLGYVGMIWITEGFTIVPFLAGSDAIQDRLRLQETIGQGKGTAFVLVTFAFHAPALQFLRNKILGRKQYSIVGVFVAVLPVLLFYTGRSYLVFTLAILAFTALSVDRTITLRRIAFLFPVLFLFWAFMLLYRMWGNFDPDNIGQLILADLLNEMRTLGMIIRQSPTTNLYPIIILTLFSQLLPSWAFSLFGYDKADFYRPIGKVIQSYYPEQGANLGFRTTLFGESYLAAGYVGLLIGMVCLGLLSIWVYRKMRVGAVTPRAYPYVVLAAIVPLLISYGITMFATVLQIYVVAIIVSRIATSRTAHA